VTLEEYVGVLRDRWRTVTVVVLAAIALALAYDVVRPPEYTASTALYVSAQAGDVQQAFQGTQLSEQRVKSYTELVTSDRVLGETIRELGLSSSVPALAARTTATSPLDSVIIDIEVTGDDPQGAAAIANTLAATTIRVVGELEAPPAGGVAPVVVRVVQPAAPPAVPTSAGVVTVLGVGALAGIALGVGAARLWERLDRTVGSVDELERIAQVPSIGLVAEDPAFAATPLLSHNDPLHPAAESFRQIRTNLQFADVDSPPATVLVTSAMPGEGKTTVAANLALVLSTTVPRVLLIEADLRRPRLSALFGLDRSVGLTSVLAGRLALFNAVQDWRGGAVSVLASGPTPPNPSELLASNQMKSLLQQARAHYDFVVVDAPPLLPVTDAAALAGTLDGTILVCRHGSTTTDQLVGARNALQSVSARVLGSVFTAVPKKHLRAHGGYSDYYGTDRRRPDGASSVSWAGSRTRQHHPTDREPTVRVPPGDRESGDRRRSDI
jgi:capsular exopolysaccharide synthesis family protein